MLLLPRTDWGLRDYGVAGQIGLEESFEEFLEKLVAVFEEVRRVLRPDGTAWVNMGDSYGSRTDGSHGGWNGDTYEDGANPQRVMNDGNGRKLKMHTKPKDLIGQPWALAFALREAGWWLRSEIIWHKPNPMPESITDRPTKSHEQVFLLAKSERYRYDQDVTREPHTMRPQRRPKGRPVDETPRPGQPKQGWSTTARAEVDVDGHPGGRNLRTVWTIPTAPFPEAHFATFPPDLIKPCILAGCPEGGEVLDPFAGACTTLLVADRLGRNALGIELNPEYVRMGEKRIRDDCPIFASVHVGPPSVAPQTQDGVP